MNAQLVRKCPKDTTPEEFKKAWDNASWILQPLCDLLKDRLKNFDKVTEEDLKNPNHYGLLAFRLGKKEEVQYLLSLLPDSVDKNTTT